MIQPHAFQLVEVASAATTPEAAPAVAFRFAYVSDTHLYARGMTHRFAKAALKAVEDVNALDPQPDFVLFGGDLAQLGRPDELAFGQQILKELKAPVKMMVGEHDWYFDMGDEWRKRFGKDTYSFDHKGVHMVVLNSVIVEDYWTGPKMTPMERMLAMAQLDNPNGRPFTVSFSSWPSVKISSAYCCTIRPTSVSARPRPSLRKSFSPSDSSSRRSCALIVGCVRFSTSVALAMLPSRATTQK